MELFNHRLRLHADPSRVVVRPFHIGWIANANGVSRSQRLISEVMDMSPQEARDQLDLVLKDFELMCFADAMEHEQVSCVTMTVRADDVLVEVSPADATRFLVHLTAKHGELSAADKAHWALRGGELRALLSRSV